MSKKPQNCYSASNILLQASYARHDAQFADEVPGEFPYTRGIHPDMYRQRLWTMRQYSGYGSASQTNQRFHYLLSQGTTGLSVAFDLATQMGLDCDHARAKGEVGRVGVSISSLDDMRTLFKGIALDKVSVSMTINSTAAVLLAMLITIAEEQGLSASQLSGTVQNDILKEYIARGTYIYPAKPALRLVTDLIEYSCKELPKWNPISISGYHMREAGSDAIQELAFTFANAICYVEHLIARNLSIDQFAGRLAFFFNCHTDFFEEIAKFRAARRIWARIMRERFAAKDPRSLQLRFHTQTAGSSLTAQQPLNNVVRTTLQALAAVLGGTQSLHTNSYDEALALPTEESALLALRTQQIIAHESGVANVADALGGSFLLENLTSKVECEVFKLIEQIDQMGGMVNAIQARFPQAEIERAAYDLQRRIEAGEKIIVGINSFARDQEKAEESQNLESQAKVEQEQLAALKHYKSKRQINQVERSLIALKNAAQTNCNLMPLVLASVKEGATLGEISAALGAVFGVYSSGT